MAHEPHCLLIDDRAPVGLGALIVVGGASRLLQPDANTPTLRQRQQPPLRERGPAGPSLAAERVAGATYPVDGPARRVRLPGYPSCNSVSGYCIQLPPCGCVGSPGPAFGSVCTLRPLIAGFPPDARLPCTGLRTTTNGRYHPTTMRSARALRAVILNLHHAGAPCAPAVSLACYHTISRARRPPHARTEVVERG